MNLSAQYRTAVETTDAENSLRDSTKNLLWSKLLCNLNTRVPIMKSISMPWS